MDKLDCRVVALVAILFVSVGLASAQEDFSDAIKCYECTGDAVNSTCADPIEAMEGLKEIICDYGLCVKWTKYHRYELKMIRTCSQRVNFHLTMVDGVCRTERNGNGKLCMCGKSLCNSGMSWRHRAGVTAGATWAVALSGWMLYWSTLH